LEKCTHRPPLRCQQKNKKQLTAALRGELPQLQLFEGEVDVGGELAGSDVGVGEALQV